MSSFPKSMLKYYHPDDFELLVEDIDDRGAMSLSNSADMNFMGFMAGDFSRHDIYPTGSELAALSKNIVVRSWGITEKRYNELLMG